MNASTVRAIINQAESIDCYDLLVIVDDNYRCYRVKSETSTCIFDDSKEVVMCFCANDNPIKDTMNESRFLVEWVDYDHITSIYLLPPEEDIKNEVSSLGFDDEDSKPIIQKLIKTFRADGFQTYDGSGKDLHKPKMPEVTLGVPYKPYKKPEPNEEETTENTEG